MKILYITPWFPCPPSNGSKLRIYNLLKSLLRRHKVRIISFVRTGEEINPALLEEMVDQVVVVDFKEFSPNRLKAILGYFSKLPRSVVDTYSNHMAERISLAISEFCPDIILFSEFGTAVYRPDTEIPCILDEFQIATLQDRWNSGNSWTRLRNWLTWFKHMRMVRHMLPNFAVCTVASSQEHANLMKILPKFPNVFVVPNGVDTTYNKPDPWEIEDGQLVYNGALTYSANYEAMQYFLAEIFPIIRTQYPLVKLRITGAYDGVDLSGLNLDTNVELTGYKVDVRPSVGTAWACVVPLITGGGTRLKILEAMALGTPVVATSKGAEGIKVKNHEDILIADNPREFASHVVRLLNSRSLRDRLSIAGRALVEKQYSWDSIGQEFLEIIDQFA